MTLRSHVLAAASVLLLAIFLQAPLRAMAQSSATTAVTTTSSAAAAAAANETVVGGIMPPSECQAQCAPVVTLWQSTCTSQRPSPVSDAEYQQYAYDLAACVCPSFRGNAHVQSCITCVQTSAVHGSTPSTALLTQVSADCQPGSIRAAANDILLALGVPTSIPADSPLVTSDDSSKKVKSNASSSASPRTPRRPLPELALLMGTVLLARYVL
ncbi:hypothetical protein CXG81DRAFT_28084 [Caulochytrium protostelioides]|uniref:Extracellular membrane protein CFEM domain-containing protein n=1 Tax=Caulochytrium protostelioides TaxID=1555241 RepID=A0A4P9X005_9FUNG|nr:hypothetical protein CXG81DRAFT_28084 [Caulochytrium protostelioides]|eukprot:RKO99134.1 hypothetical protein CXG81DRAFT_28084 [Caulochytrium protostelioides]